MFLKIGKQIFETHHMREIRSTDAGYEFIFVNGAVSMIPTDFNHLVECWIQLMEKSGRIMDLALLYEQKIQVEQNIDNILGGNLTNLEAQKNTNTSKQSVEDTLEKLRERLKQKKVENKLKEDIDNE